MPQIPTNLKGMVNEFVEEIFMDAFVCYLADIDENKKQEMNLLMRNVVVEVVKGGRIQELICRLTSRTVTNTYSKVPEIGYQ